MLEQHKLIAADFGRVTLGEEEYRCIAVCGKMHVVVGGFIGYSDLSRGQVFAARQRVTLVWSREADETMLLHHYHVSNPLDIVEEGERFPVRYAQQTGRYVDAFLASCGVDGSRGVLSLRDVEGVTHFVRPFEFIYIEADAQRSVVHTLSGTFSVRRGIAELLEEIDPEQAFFVQVHRRYAVNAAFVKEMSPASLALSDGTELPISSRRSVQAREHIERILAKGASRDC